MAEKSNKKCAECGEAAAVFISLVKGGKLTSSAWCAKHAEAAGALDPKGYALLDAQEPAENRRTESVLRCPVCDCSQRDFERQGRFGCPACYTTFRGLLAPLLTRMHRGAEHCGKIPLRGADPASVRHHLAILQARLNDAVRTEKFEGAAQTRDAIAALKAKLLAPANAASLPVAPEPPAKTRGQGTGSDTPKPASPTGA